MNVNLISPICYTGYGVAGQNIVKELFKEGHDVSLWPIGGVSIPEEDVPLFQNVINRQQNYDPNAPCVRIWHQFQLDQFVGRNKRIGFPIFELDRFNQIELHHLANVDRLFVCSKWAKEVLTNNLPGVDTRVVPLGVDQKIFYPSMVSQENQPYVFFNAGKWEKRKGHDILVEIFNKAFEIEDDVELWMMPHNPFLSDKQINEWVKLYRNSKLGSKIHILPPCDTHHGVAGIMRQTDCGIFPSRAEGWNLELLEMMACNKPCITTNYSAHTEFCTKEDTWLVDIEEMESANDGKWFFDQGNWAKIGSAQIDQFVENMRFLYKNKPNGNNSLEQSKKFTWKNSAQQLIENLA